MSTDWIKMRVDLRTHPKVVRMASALNADKLRVIGGMFAVWAIFDAHSSDGVLEGYTFKAIDSELGWKGFAQAMNAIGWLDDAGGDGLTAPRFEEHNGTSAKRRAMESERKRLEREAEKQAQLDRTLSACDADAKADTMRTREEKRREDKEIPPPAAQGSPQPNRPSKPKREKAAEVTLAEWLEAIQAKGEKAIPADDAVFAYADGIGLPREFLHVAWFAFRAKYTAEPTSGQKQKAYASWRAVFRNAVRDNWLKLWYLDGQQYALTTAGQQAQRAHQERGQ